MPRWSRTDAPATLEALHELNRAISVGREKSDVAWYSEHLAEDYLAANPDGSLVDRAGFLARIARPYPGSDLPGPEVQIQHLGEVALDPRAVRGHGPRWPDAQRPLHGYLGAPGGRWLCVSAHFTRC